MTAILEPPTATTGSPAPAPVARPLPVPPPPAPAARAAAPPPVAPTRPAPAPPEEPRAKRVLTPAGIRLLGAALVALFVVDQLLYPATDGAPPALSATQEVVVTVMTFLMVGALAGFIAGRRWAVPTALAFCALEAVNVGLCPATGHHAIGGWWYAQAAVTAVMVALPVAALLRTRAG
jgi:hypothetical protein